MVDSVNELKSILSFFVLGNQWNASIVNQVVDFEESLVNSFTELLDGLFGAQVKVIVFDDDVRLWIFLRNYFFSHFDNFLWVPTISGTKDDIAIELDKLKDCFLANSRVSSSNNSIFTGQIDAFGIKMWSSHVFFKKVKEDDREKSYTGIARDAERLTNLLRNLRGIGCLEIECKIHESKIC